MELHVPQDNPLILTAGDAFTFDVTATDQDMENGSLIDGAVPTITFFTTNAGTSDLNFVPHTTPHGITFSVSGTAVTIEGDYYMGVIAQDPVPNDSYHYHDADVSKQINIRVTRYSS